MGYRIRVTNSDGVSHLRKEVYKTRAGVEKKAKWFRKGMTPTFRVIHINCCD